MLREPMLEHVLTLRGFADAAQQWTRANDEQPKTDLEEAICEEPIHERLTPELSRAAKRRRLGRIVS